MVTDWNHAFSSRWTICVVQAGVDTWKHLALPQSSTRSKRIGISMREIRKWKGVSCEASRGKPRGILQRMLIDQAREGRLYCIDPAYHNFPGTNPIVLHFGDSGHAFPLDFILSSFWRGEGEITYIVNYLWTMRLIVRDWSWEKCSAILSLSSSYAWLGKQFSQKEKARL